MVQRHRSTYSGVLVGLLGEKKGRYGVTGLGAGSLACHAKEGEAWRFFEIDPVVARFASGRATELRLAGENRVIAITMCTSQSWILPLLGRRFALDGKGLFAAISGSQRRSSMARSGSNSS